MVDDFKLAGKGGNLLLSTTFSGRVVKLAYT